MTHFWTYQRSVWSSYVKAFIWPCAYTFVIFIWKRYPNLSEHTQISEIRSLSWPDRNDNSPLWLISNSWWRGMKGRVHIIFRPWSLASTNEMRALCFPTAALRLPVRVSANTAICILTTHCCEILCALHVLTLLRCCCYYTEVGCVQRTHNVTNCFYKLILQLWSLCSGVSSQARFPLAARFGFARAISSSRAAAAGRAEVPETEYIRSARESASLLHRVSIIIIRSSVAVDAVVAVVAQRWPSADVIVRPRGAWPALVERGEIHTPPSLSSERRRVGAISLPRRGLFVARPRGRYLRAAPRRIAFALHRRWRIAGASGNIAMLAWRVSDRARPGATVLPRFHEVGNEGAALPSARVFILFLSSLVSLAFLFRALLYERTEVSRNE